MAPRAESTLRSMVFSPEAPYPLAMEAPMNSNRAVEQPQYTLPKILGIWFAVTAPMGLFRYVVTPLALPCCRRRFTPAASSGS